MTKFIKKSQLFVKKNMGIDIRKAKPDNLIINEAINLEKEIIFIAIPKTGTTSVRTQMQQIGNPLIDCEHLNILQVRDLIYVYLLKNNLNINRIFPNKKALSDLELRSKASEIYAKCFKFSAVRNPWARAASLYARREGFLAKEVMSFDEFCELHHNASDTCFYPTLHKNQYDWLCDEKGENLMDFTYKVEEFETAIGEIRERSNGKINLEVVNRNRNPNSKSRNYQEMYTDKTRKLIAKHFERDIDLFKYTF